MKSAQVCHIPKAASQLVSRVMRELSKAPDEDICWRLACGHQFRHLLEAASQLVGRVMREFSKPPDEELVGLYHVGVNVST